MNIDKKAGKNISLFPLLPVFIYLEIIFPFHQDFNIAMVSRKFTNIDGQNFKDIPTWWGEFRNSTDCAALAALSGEKPGELTGGVMLGVCYEEEKTLLHVLLLSPV